MIAEIRRWLATYALRAAQKLYPRETTADAKVHARVGDLARQMGEMEK